MRAQLSLLDVRDHMSETAMTSKPAPFKVSSSASTELKATWEPLAGEDRTEIERQ